MGCLPRGSWPPSSGTPRELSGEGRRAPAAPSGSGSGEGRGDGQAGAWKGSRVLACMALVAGAQGTTAATGDSCPAAASGAACGRPAPSPPRGQAYHWPHARGRVGSYGSTGLYGPSNLSALAWTWQHPDKHILPGACLLDELRNVYVPALDGIRKFSPDGSILWFYRPNGLAISNPSLMDGMLFGSTFSGHMFAISMDSGEERWSIRAAQDCEMDAAFVEAHDGVVLGAFDSRPTSTSVKGNVRVVALNASNGLQLWQFTSVEVLWNHMPVFPGDGTYVTMDVHGGLYRRWLRNGSRVWHLPGNKHGWTDGGVILGPGADVAYSCSSQVHGAIVGGLGMLRALRVSDGQPLWQKGLPEPCASWPAVSGDNSTVVVPVGAIPLASPPAYSLAQPFWALWPLTLALRLLSCGCCSSGSRCRRGLAWAHLAALLWAVACFTVLHLLCNLLEDRADFYFGAPPKPLKVLAFDARTGEQRWRFDGIQSWSSQTARGDKENILWRLWKSGNEGRTMCGPASWSAPTVDGHGKVYAAAMDGYLYAIRDANDDGTIDNETEVDKLDLGAASLHAGTSFAPGLMAHASCDQLFVWNT